MPMGIADIIIGAIILVLVVLVVRKLRKDKKNGGGSCSCNCQGCGMSGSCHKPENVDN